MHSVHKMISPSVARSRRSMLAIASAIGINLGLSKLSFAQGTRAAPNSPSKLTIIGRLEAKPGQEARLRQALLDETRVSRQDRGCINYDLHVDLANPGHFVIYENWANDEALKAHFETAHSKALAARLPELLAKPLTMERLSEISEYRGRKPT